MVLAERGFRVVANYRSSAEQTGEAVQATTANGVEAVERQDATTVHRVAHQRWHLRGGDRVSVGLHIPRDRRRTGWRADGNRGLL